MRFIPVAVWVGLLTLTTTPVLYGQTPHLTITQPGGMPGLPVMTGIQQRGTNNEVEITWDGPAGYYRLMSKLGLMDTEWQEAGPWSTNRAAVVTGMQEAEFFSVIGPAPSYAGSRVCRSCHFDIHESEMETLHASALETLKHIGQDENPSCLPCHTVGYGLPTGYTTELATPYLAGVQCENCHGPASRHADNPDNVAIRPQVEIAAQMCGGCHTDSHHPTYDEWSESPHAEVLEELKADFIANPSFISNCGRCHSGSVRLAYIRDEPLPDGEEASAIGITCATCHDPHANHVRTNVVSGLVTTNQLRNPTASLEDYHTGGDWSTNYNENINICGQCHNDRGASWTGTSRPPHHSPQYNVMLGTAGLLPDGWVQRGGYHARTLPDQCATCHMQTEEYQSESLPAVTGHTFEVQSYDVCVDCHLYPEKLVELADVAVNGRVERVQQLLDRWATNNAPEAWQIKYGTRAWEYANPGDLSAGGPGPTSAEQAALLQEEAEAREQHPNDPTLPDFRKIQQARFNLYLVVYDGSAGVHNGSYEVDLLDAATEWVLEELDPVEAFLFELNRLP